MGIGQDLRIVPTVERLNRILNKSRLTTKFISLFYGEFESEGEVIFVNAGHPAPLLLRSGTGEFEALDPTGMVLGPSPNALYARRAAKLGPKDLVVLYTDGITEAADLKGREFGVDRLKRLAFELRKRPAQEIVGSVRCV